MKKIMVVILPIVVIGLAAGGYLYFSKDKREKDIVTVDMIERHLTPAILAEDAELIVLGTFTDSRQRTFIDEDHNLVLTDWTIQPKEVWKGNAPDPLVVSIIQSDNGGIVEESALPFSIKNGTQALLYLTFAPEGQMWLLLSARQGVFLEKNGKLFDQLNKVVDRQVLYQEVLKEEKKSE